MLVTALNQRFLYIIMLVTALNSIPVPSFVACGIINELHVHEHACPMVSFCGFQKKLIMPIVCASPNSIFLPSFMCRGAVVSEIREFNLKEKKKMMENSKKWPFYSSPPSHCHKFYQTQLLTYYISNSNVRSLIHC